MGYYLLNHVLHHDLIEAAAPDVLLDAFRLLLRYRVVEHLLGNLVPAHSLELPYEVLLLSLVVVDFRRNVHRFRDLVVRDLVLEKPERALVHEPSVFDCVERRVRKHERVRVHVVDLPDQTLVPDGGHRFDHDASSLRRNEQSDPLQAPDPVHVVRKWFVLALQEVAVLHHFDVLQFRHVRLLHLLVAPLVLPGHFEHAVDHLPLFDPGVLLNDLREQRCVQVS